MPGTDDQEQRAEQKAGEETQEPTTVTDADLDRAWEDAVSGKEDRQEAPATETPEQEKQETGSEEGKGEEEAAGDQAAGEEEKAEEEAASADEGEPQKADATEDHKERTKLGRKVAKLEDTLSQVLEQNRILLEKLTPKPAEPKAEAPADIEDIDLSTPEGIDRYLEIRERQKQETANREIVQYQTGYKGQLDSWKGQADEADEGTSAEVYKLLTDPKSPFNVRYSSDPQADFTLNLAKAEAHYYREKAKAGPERKNPLEANKNRGPKAPTAVGGTAKADPPKAPPSVNLDPASRELAASMGMTDEEVARYLSSPVPMHLQPGRGR